jgi:hypothetical protein
MNWERWSLLWRSAFVYTFVCLKQPAQTTVVLLLTVVLPVLLYPALYLFSAWSPYTDHLHTSLPRLLLQVSLVAILIIGLAVPLEVVALKGSTFRKPSLHRRMTELTNIRISPKIKLALATEFKLVYIGETMMSAEAPRTLNELFATAVRRHASRSSCASSVTSNGMKSQVGSWPSGAQHCFGLHALGVKRATAWPVGRKQSRMEHGRITASWPTARSTSRLSDTGRRSGRVHLAQ